MYAVSFRVFVGEFAGSKVFINGSCLSSIAFFAGEPLKVCGPTGKPIAAEAIESNRTQRNDFKWKLVSA